MCLNSNTNVFQKGNKILRPRSAVVYNSVARVKCTLSSLSLSLNIHSAVKECTLLFCLTCPLLIAITVRIPARLLKGIFYEVKLRRRHQFMPSFACFVFICLKVTKFSETRNKKKRVGEGGGNWNCLFSYLEKEDGKH